MLKHEVKAIPNHPISIHLNVHQGQLIMEAGAKTAIHSGPAGIVCNAALMHLVP